ncbi:hypothetical protein BDC45DRAFT_501019 [Circinella umbellata]|nr:hypothetical protein BDC45DRAFT_501019 [Circinella umbellata]
MKPVLDYTKWVKMVDDMKKQGVQLKEDTPEDNKPLERAPVKPALKECQCVRVYSVSEQPANQGIFGETTISTHHGLFTSGRTLISPISQKIGIPLMIYLENPLSHALFKPELRELYVNQPITFLLARISNGFSPLHYQDGVGTALVARLDQKPLSIELMAIICAYIDMLMTERYGAIDPSQVQHTITPTDFNIFYRDCMEATRNHGLSF